MCLETFTAEDIVRVIDSLADNNSYYTFNVRPVDRMLTFLQRYFSPKQPTKIAEELLFSLDLGSSGGGGYKKSAFSNYSFSSLYEGFSYRMGYGDGAKLSHNHSTQYVFVLQSLSLWREIMSNMPLLWFFADRDMLAEPYRLCDTGQGYQRVQSCPTVGRLMRNILSAVQKASAYEWVGLSVVHLGDRDVPNGTCPP